jgi:hypothetical protein
MGCDGGAGTDVLGAVVGVPLGLLVAVGAWVGFGVGRGVGVDVEIGRGVGFGVGFGVGLGVAVGVEVPETMATVMEAVSMPDLHFSSSRDSAGHAYEPTDVPVTLTWNLTMSPSTLMTSAFVAA